MAKLVRGPFTIKWGDNEITNVSEVTVNYDVATNDYETVQGQTFTIEGAHTASIDITLLASDVETLSVIFPQYYVAPGATMSTGEKVSEESGSEGAIDIVAAKCETSDIVYPLDLISCNGEVFRLVNTKSSLSGVDLDNNVLRTVTVSFRGVPAETGTVGVAQMFKEGTLEPES